MYCIQWLKRISIEYTRSARARNAIPLYCLSYVCNGFVFFAHLYLRLGLLVRFALFRKLHFANNITQIESTKSDMPAQSGLLVFSICNIFTKKSIVFIWMSAWIVRISNLRSFICCGSSPNHPQLQIRCKQTIKKKYWTKCIYRIRWLSM